MQLPRSKDRSRFGLALTMRQVVSASDTNSAPEWAMGYWQSLGTLVAAAVDGAQELQDDRVESGRLFQIYCVSGTGHDPEAGAGDHPLQVQAWLQAMPVLIAGDHQHRGGQLL